MKEGKKKEISAAERGKLPPIFMIYRDNDLFKEWIPKVTETLRGIGRKVEIQSFPPGTEKEKIKEWIEQNRDKVKGKLRICDETIGNIIEKFFPMLRKEKYSEKLYKKTKIEKRDRQTYLDVLFEEFTKRAVFKQVKKAVSRETGMKKEEIESLLDPMPDSEADKVEAVKKVYLTLVRNIIKDKSNLPKEVHIFTQKMTDHGPFANKGSETGDIFKNWLIEAGIPEESIKKRDDCAPEWGKGDWEEKDWDEYDECKKDVENYSKKILLDIDKKKNWIISDRHNQGIYEYSRPHQAIALQLPLVNFIKSASEAGLIELSPQKVEQEMIGKIEEDFGKKSEEEG